jgi:hypothetical protein
MLHFSTANLARDAHLEEDLKRIALALLQGRRLKENGELTGARCMAAMLKKALASLVFRR